MLSDFSNEGYFSKEITKNSKRPLNLNKRKSYLSYF